MKTTNWKNWAKAALVRAIRTFAEAMLAYIGTGALVLGDVNWLAALSAGGFGFITAILLAMTGLPEAEQERRVRSGADCVPEAGREAQAGQADAEKEPVRRCVVRSVLL